MVAYAEREISWIFFYRVQVLRKYTWYVCKYIIQSAWAFALSVLSQLFSSYALA